MGLFLTVRYTRYIFVTRGTPWQHGARERTHYVRRQYLPRQADVLVLCLQTVLNQEPRKTLGFKTSADKLQ